MEVVQHEETAGPVAEPAQQPHHAFAENHDRVDARRGAIAPIPSGHDARQCGAERPQLRRIGHLGVT